MNQTYDKIKMILFDSGYTLNKPRTGHWFIPPGYQQIISPVNVNRNSMFFKLAMFKARKYLDKNHLIKTEEEEYQLFKSFYSMIFSSKRYSSVSADIIDMLARDLVFNDEKLEFFDQVENTLKVLSERYQIGILSDTWPSLERVFANKGLMKYFSCFIMSSVHGVCKSDGKLFQIALGELEYKPEEILFIDDSELNLRMAQKAGIIPVKACTYNGKKPSSLYPNINSLDDLLKLL
jgi:putative hydrolase of the HAD superfamily